MSVNLNTSVIYGFMDISANITDELLSLAEEELDIVDIYDEQLFKKMLKKKTSSDIDEPSIFFIGCLQADINKGMSQGSLTSTLSMSDEEKSKVDQFIAKHCPQYKAETHLIVSVN